MNKINAVIPECLYRESSCYPLKRRVNGWIPAFAGMTAVFLLILSGCAPYRPPPFISSSSSVQPTDRFHLPLKNPVVLSRFGKRGRRFHTGLDLRGRRGGRDAVFASRSGRVLEAGKRKGYGHWVVIRHSDGFITRYAHLKKISVRRGESVKALEQVGTVGATGRATTPHLHFEILTPSGRFVDPAEFIFKKTKS